MSAHGKPPPDTECMCSFEDINESNYVEYQTAPSEKWHPAKFSEPIVSELMHLAPRSDYKCRSVRCWKRKIDIIPSNMLEIRYFFLINLADPSRDTWTMLRRLTTISSELLFFCDGAVLEQAARDCAAAVRRLVSKARIANATEMSVFERAFHRALPSASQLPEGDTHVVQVWFCSTNTEETARLKGALEGADRDNLWDSQKEVLAMMEAAEASSKSEEVFCVIALNLFEWLTVFGKENEEGK
eukprot:761547-Hanusia_phi.AAC.2